MTHNSENNLYADFDSGFGYNSVTRFLNRCESYMLESTSFPDTPSFPPLEESLWPQPAPTWRVAPYVQPSHYNNDTYPGEIFNSNLDILNGYPSFFQSRTWEGHCQYYSSVSQPNPYRPPPPTPPLTPTSGLNHPLAIVTDDVCFIQPGHGWGSNHNKTYGLTPFTLSSTPTSVADDVGFVKNGWAKVETGVDCSLAPLVTKSNDKANPRLKAAGTNKFRPIREAETNHNSISNPMDRREYPSSGSTAVERESASREAHEGRNDIERGPAQKTTKRGDQGKRYDLYPDRRLFACTSLVQKASSSKRKSRDDDSGTSPPPPSKRKRPHTTSEGHISGPSNDNSSSSQLKLDTFAMDSVHDQADLQGSERTSL